MNNTKNKIKCSICSKTIANNHRSIHCQNCSKSVHIKCNNTDDDTFKQVKDGIIPGICIKCQCTNSDSIQSNSETEEANQVNTMPFSSISDTAFRTLNHDLHPHNTTLTKIPCAVCSKTIAKNHRKIVCEACNNQVHIKCNHTDVTTYNNMIKKNLPQKCIICDPCIKGNKPRCFVCNHNIAQNHRKLECKTCKNFVHIKCNRTDPKSYNRIIKTNGSPTIDHCNNCVTENIPFQNLTEIEFTALSKGIDTEADILNDTFITSGNLKAFFNIINKTNPFDNDGISFNKDDPDDDTVLINCKYYDLSTFNFKKQDKQFSLFHTNIGSLEKHKEELEITLSMLEFKFDLIALTETKIKKRVKPKYNINMDGYKAYYMPTESEKGGTLVYISDSIQSKRRLDLESILYKSEELESTFIEIINQTQKNIIGCIYRHPSMDLTEFNTEFMSPFLQKFEKENKRKYILGDFNVDLLKLDEDSKSSSFFDSLSSHLFIPHIHPTRITSTSKTVIDNIFSNAENFMLSQEI